MAATAYATTADFALYMKDVNQPANEAIAKFLLSSVSRWLDNQLGQYFYSDGYSTKRFNSSGQADIYTGKHRFYGKVGTVTAVGGGAIPAGATSLVLTQTWGPPPDQGDSFQIDVAATQETATVNTVSGTAPGPYTLTVPATTFGHVAGVAASTVAVRLAYFENQPISQWVPNLSGDGINPPSNYYCYPENPDNAGSSADPTQHKPWEGIEIAHIPISQTQFLPSTIPGYRTIQISAHWGWPVVPDPIKDFTTRWCVKMWRARASGWAEALANPATGEVHKFLDLNAMDEATVLKHDYKQWAF